MLLKFHLDRLSNAIGEMKLYRFTVIALLIGFAYDRYEIRQMRLQDRTIVVPPVVNSRIEITGGKATDSYVREYAVRYLVPLVLSYTPATARTQFGEFLSSWHKDTFEAAKSKLYLLADQIEQTKAISAFYVGKVNHDAGRKVVEIEGNRRLNQQDQQVENTNKSYVLTYAVENGRFWVTSFEEKADLTTARPGGGMRDVSK